MNKKKNITVTYRSLGCFKNDVDTEVVLGNLEKRGFQIVPDEDCADWMIINTCGFIRDSKEESIDTIFNALELKETGDVKNVAVFGCLIERYIEDIREEFKEVDILWGVNGFDELCDRIEQETPGIYQRGTHPLFLYDHDDSRYNIGGEKSAYIKIAEGCNMTCSFCAIPSIRGHYRSREIHSIVDEAEQIFERGVEELIVISQNTSWYGTDIEGETMLPELIKELSAIGFKWIRILYLMPEDVNEEMLTIFRLPGVLPYFDLPFQHVSERILQKMNRRGNSAEKIDLIRKIRSQYKDSVIRATFITGFPGEQETDFEELKKFAEESEIERIGAFAYSDEENTTAFEMEPKVDPGLATDRRELIMDISDFNIEKYNRKIENTTTEFLPLGPCPWDSGSSIGRIASQAPEVDGLTVVKTPFEEMDSITEIRITGFENEILYGEKV